MDFTSLTIIQDWEEFFFFWVEVFRGENSMTKFPFFFLIFFQVSRTSFLGRNKFFLLSCVTLLSTKQKARSLRKRDKNGENLRRLFFSKERERRCD